MKAFLSVMAVAVAVALALPVPGEAQTKKSKAKSAQTTQQKHVPRRAKVAAGAASAKPCVGRTWQGCVGWDPDPRIRDSLWDTHNGGP